LVSKKGFSLVELLVVMTIFVLLSTLGVSAIVRNRNINKVNAVASQLKADIRRAQLNALTIEGSCADPSAGRPKAWAVFIGNISGKIGYELRYWCADAGGTWYGATSASAPFRLSEGTDLYFTDSNIEFTGSLDQWIIFTSPIGAFHRVSGGSPAMNPNNDLFRSFSPVGALTSETSIVIQGVGVEKELVVNDSYGFVEIR